MPDVSWPAVVARLASDERADPKASARLLSGASPWDGRVVPRTSHDDLLFTLPGDEHPFARSVRVMCRGDEYEFWLLDRDQMVGGSAVIREDRSDVIGASEMLDSFLADLVGPLRSESK